ncbi:MAG: DUF3060 domain-containing protein [Janthinobacterium lividum]
MNTAKLFPAVLLFGTVAPAQREVPMPAYVPPGPPDAIVSGDRLPRTITCHDRIRVYIQGTANEVQIYGDCGQVRVRGDRNFVWLDRDAQIAVEGDNNLVYIRTPTARVSSRGSGNRFELRR